MKFIPRQVSVVVDPGSGFLFVHACYVIFLTQTGEMRVVLLVLMAVAVFGSAISEEIDEDQWWYAPSRKAPLYQHKYQGLREQLIRVAAKQGEDMRLPRDVLPDSYNIRLLPFIEVNNFTTDGYIEIFVDCKSATRNISMNAADLTINEASIKVYISDEPPYSLDLTFDFCFVIF